MTLDLPDISVHSTPRGRGLRKRIVIDYGPAYQDRVLEAISDLVRPATAIERDAARPGDAHEQPSAGNAA